MAATPAWTKEQQELREALEVKPPDAIVEYINALFYGDPGAGKTYLAGSADDDPRTSPMLILDVEGGLATVRSKSNIDVKPIRSRNDINTIYNSLFNSIKDGKIMYKTVVIDSLTELADLDMRTIMKAAYEQNPDKVNIDVPSQREWGIARAHVRTIVRAFRDLPCNVIYTAHVGTLQEEGQQNKYFPGFSGKLRTEVPGFMDIVGYLSTTVDQGVVTRTLQVLGTKRVVAKDRTGRLAGETGYIENPTIPMIWDMIHK